MGLRVKVLRNSPYATFLEVGKVYEIADKEEYDSLDWMMIEATRERGENIVIIRIPETEKESAVTGWAFLKDIEFVAGE